MLDEETPGLCLFMKHVEILHICLRKMEGIYLKSGEPVFNNSIQESKQVDRFGWMAIHVSPEGEMVAVCRQSK